MSELLTCPKCGSHKVAIDHGVFDAHRARFRWCQNCRAQFSLSEARKATDEARESKQQRSKLEGA